MRALFDDGRLIEQTVDHGDGTGTRTTYTTDGTVAATEQLTGLPIPEPLAPTTEEQVTAVIARLDRLAPVPPAGAVPADPTYRLPATDLRSPR